MSAYRKAYIGHLKDVYENYRREVLDLQVKDGKIRTLSLLPGILSLFAFLAAFYIADGRILLLISAIVLLVAFIAIRYVHAVRFPRQMQDLQDRFREQYVCPNPNCRHFLGQTPYRELLFGGCPYCRREFTDVALARVICPSCHTALIVKDDPSNIGKSLTCPACHKRDKYTNFRILPLDETDDTELDT